MSIVRTVRQLAISVVIVLLTAVPIVAAIGWLVSERDLRPPLSDVADRVEAVLEQNADWLPPFIAAPPANDHVMDGRLRPDRPRILVPGLATWSGYGPPALIAARNDAYGERQVAGIPADPCSGTRLLQIAACYVTSGDDAAGERGLAALDRFEVSRPRSSGRYGNAWQLAIAYDLLARYPMMALDQIVTVEQRLQAALEDQLAVLDAPTASLWHGRSTLAGYAWITAAALTPGMPHRDRLIARAQAHFLESMEALRLTEAWPEGYNYWIQNRALPLILGATAYLNGLEDARNAPAIRHLLTRVGLWHIYATRPDHRIEGFGDEGARPDLRHDTRPVIDLIVQATGDPALAGYSRYLGRLRGADSYGPDTRWAFRLFNDPLISPLPGMEDGDLAPLEYALPQADVFGRDAMNQVYIRAGWGAADTMITFRAGNVFTHHGHYDAGHFTLFHGAPLAVNSSTYGDFFGPNRLHYAIRTVAKNSLLVMRPGERVRPTAHFVPNIADGGQRIVLPTGGAIRDTEHWRRNLESGLHLAGGELLRVDHLADSHAYLLADLTAAYNTPAHDEGGIGGKVVSVQRELFYLFEEDVLLVNDDVSVVDPRYLAKWLMHSIERPQIDDLRLLRGEENDGILETDASLAVVRNGNSFVRVHRLEPVDGVMRLIGGPNHRYYVEYDGDDRALDGVNVAPGAAEDARFEIADWRIEIQPRQPRGHTRFLVALVPSLDRPSLTPVSPIAVADDLARGVEVGQTAVLFLEPTGTGPISLAAPLQADRLYVTGLEPFSPLQLTSDHAVREILANGNGVAYSPLHGLTGRLELAW